MQRRKIQLIAGTTYSVSLPKDWIRKNNLKENQASFTIARDKLPKFFKVLSEMPIIDIDINSPALEDIFMKYYEMKKPKEGS